MPVNEDIIKMKEVDMPPRFPAIDVPDYAWRDVKLTGNLCPGKALTEERSFLTLSRMFCD